MMDVLTKLKDLTVRISNRCKYENNLVVIPKYFAGFGESRYIIKLLKYDYTDKEMSVKTIKLTLDESFKNEDNGSIVEDLFNQIKEV